MAANLSDRLIDSSKDDLQKINELDLVQKILMTGDLSGRNRSVAQRVYKNLNDMSDMTEKYYTKCTELPLNTEEKVCFEKMKTEYPPIWIKYLDQLKEAVGPVPDEFMSAPPRPLLNEYKKMMSDLLEKGSVIHLLVSSVADYLIPINIYKYLTANPNYKDNNLAKLMTFQGMGCEQALDSIKAFIDNRANEVNPELESELTLFLKNKVKFELIFCQKEYEDI